MSLQINQLIALIKGAKTKAHQDVTLAYHQLQQKEKLSGISRSYQPKDDEGEKLPSESTQVQVRVNDAIEILTTGLGRFFDLELTKDVGNQEARSDIVLEDGTVLAAAVPVSYLLFLEKQLADILAFVNKIPVLDPSELWAYDPAVDVFVSKPAQTVRTKKIPRNHVLAVATDKHPAQVQMYTEDVLVGYWSTMKFSGALPQARVKELRSRVLALIDAVKKAREAANSMVVQDRTIAEDLFEYLFHS